MRELHAKGIDLSIARLFDLLNRIDEVALIWPRRPGRPSASHLAQRRDTMKLSEMSTEQRQIFDALNLSRLAPRLI